MRIVGMDTTPGIAKGSVPSMGFVPTSIKGFVLVGVYVAFAALRLKLVSRGF
jgi:hypothetical protein